MVNVGDYCDIPDFHLRVLKLKGAEAHLGTPIYIKLLIRSQQNMLYFITFSRIPSSVSFKYKVFPTEGSVVIGSPGFLSA